MCRALYSLLILPLFASPAGARVLSETEFLSLVDDTHPAVIALDRELAQAEAVERSASVLDNPDFRAEREAWGQDAQQTTIGLSWAPPLDGRRGPNRNAARAGVEAARHRRQAACFRLRAEARAAYAAWWAAGVRSAFLEEQTARVRTVVSRMVSRAATGEESRLDASRFELALIRVEADRIRAEVEYSRALARIRTWDQTLDPDRAASRPDLPAAPDTLAGTPPPGVLALDAAVRAAESGETGAGRFLTFPSLEFGWTWLDGEDLGVDGPVVGLAWNVPLFDRNQPRRTAAAGNLRAARAELELGDRRARANLTAADHAYSALRAPALDAWEATADLTPLLDAALGSFRAGESNSTDFLDVLSSLLDARMSALALYVEALAAHRALELASGTPLTPGASR